jgi:integration host factor subunit beta
MTRSELIQKLADQNHRLSTSDMQLSIKVILAKGGRIEMRGFGSFTLNYKPPRKGRNPKSGEPVMVPAKYVPHFKAGKELRERVDSK